MTALGLEQIRKHLSDEPIYITSGYRSAALNELVGGVSNSDHAKGYAADITCGSHTAYQLAKLIAYSDIAFDQVIYEPDRSIVHVSFNPRLRGQVLTQLGGPGSDFVKGVIDV